VIIGVTIWGDQVSPLLDAATRLLTVEVACSAVRSRQLVWLPSFAPLQRVARIEEMGVDSVICGAISYEYEILLKSHKIEVIAWVRGNVDDVIKAYLDGTLNTEIHRLPGRSVGTYVEKPHTDQFGSTTDTTGSSPGEEQ
jgi:predicted Fe-Mo cluster-binding NifX family protein